MSSANNQAQPDRDDSDNQPHTVLLIHDDQLGSRLIWTQVRPLLDEYGLRVLAFDEPGDHRTTVSGLNLFGSAAALAEDLDERQTSPTVVVGYSLGAGVALALAALAPPRVRALVLIAPVAAPTAFTRTGRVLAAPILGATVSWLGRRTASLARHIAAASRRIMSDRVDLTATAAGEVRRRLIQGRRWRNFTVDHRRLITDARLLQDRLDGITCPVVIVAGTRDRLVRPGSASALAKRLPTSRLIRTDAGHRIPTEDPDIVAAAVLSALRRQYQQHPFAIPSAHALTDASRGDFRVSSTKPVGSVAVAGPSLA
jgi:pimeloyl-ACP methyl ester carboxylesterase